VIWIPFKGLEERLWREGFSMRTAAMNRTSAARRLNPKRYARLLSERPPMVIRTGKKPEEMSAAIWELMKKGEDNLSPEELAFTRTDVGPGRAI
jgi:hypothetical protein